MKNNIAIMFLIITLLITGCSIQQEVGTDSLDEAIIKSERLNDSIILDKEVVDGGVLIFHIPTISHDNAESKLGVEFVRKGLTGWSALDNGGAYSSGIKQSLYSQYFPKQEKTPFPIVYGEIKDSNITQVVVKVPGSSIEKQAKIVKVKRKPGMEVDMIIWYALLDHVKGNVLAIEGKTNSNKVNFTIHEKI